MGLVRLRGLTGWEMLVSMGATAGYIGKCRLADREAGSLTRCCKCHDVEMRGHPHLDRVGRIL